MTPFVGYNNAGHMNTHGSNKPVMYLILINTFSTAFQQQVIRSNRDAKEIEGIRQLVNNIAEK